MIESLDVDPDNFAKVVVMKKTGTVVIGHGVEISAVAITHGDLVSKSAKVKRRRSRTNYEFT